MRRKAIEDLLKWSGSSNRKPLILRGARQVGKSTLVRLFCQEYGLELIEVNLEIEKLQSVEDENFRIQALIDEVQLKSKKKITSKVILFFDEVQESPRLLKLLRYFYEQEPNVKVIAAGSLLEIALKEEDFSFPVGRVEFYYLGPMSFQEFLWATQQDFLDEKLTQFDFSKEVHTASIQALKDYYYTGGMPEAVKSFVESGSLFEVRKIQDQILLAYKADFPKYNKRIDSNRISRIFTSLALYSGNKIIYSKLDKESKSREIKRVVELLTDSRVILPCLHTSGNKNPLEAESDSKIYKTYFIDIGLLNSIHHIDLQVISNEFKNSFITKGLLAEQFVAQHVNYFYGSANEPRLYYYLRDKDVQKAEIDFLIEHQDKVIPIEVKSTAAGHLKSLKLFSEQKKSSLAIKASFSEFRIEKEFTKDATLVSLPIYAIEYLKMNLEKLY